MIIPIGSTQALSIGPFAATSGTPSVSLRVNGVAHAAAGSASAVGSDGCCSYTPGVADTSTAGQLVILATLAGQTIAASLQVGPVPADEVTSVPSPAAGFTLTTTHDAGEGSVYAGAWTPAGSYQGSNYWTKGGMFAFKPSSDGWALNSTLGGVEINNPTSSDGIHFGDFWGNTWTASPGLATIASNYTITSEPSGTAAAAALPTPIINITPAFPGPATVGNVATGNFLAVQNSLFSVTFPVIDSSGNPINLSGITGLELVFADPNSNNAAVITATIGSGARQRQCGRHQQQHRDPDAGRDPDGHRTQLELDPGRRSHEANLRQRHAPYPALPELVNPRRSFSPFLPLPFFPRSIHSMDRREELLAPLDNLLAAHAAWQETDNPEISPELMQRIEDAITVFSGGDMPGDLLHVYSPCRRSTRPGRRPWSMPTTPNTCRPTRRPSSGSAWTQSAASASSPKPRTTPKCGRWNPWPC